MRKLASGIALGVLGTAALTVAAVVYAQAPGPRSPPPPPTAQPAPAQPAPAQPPAGRPQAQPSNPEAVAAFADIQQTLGLVPMYMRAFPEVAIAAAWEEFKALELSPDTALDGKTKELISLGVAAQIPCKYCVYFHSQAARGHGATDEDLEEAVAMAAVTRHWSTVLNGMQTDDAAFRRETARIMTYLKSGRKPSGPAPSVTDAASAYKDIERTLGSVPSFLRSFPEGAIGPAWREMKTVQLGRDTRLPPRTKELIGLAVAAQVPCKYCSHFHTEAAKLSGASDREVKEAVALAALTRHWSTVLNGSQIDEDRFRREVDQIMSQARRRTTMREPAAPQPGAPRP